LASHPSFDPNVFSGGIPADLWEELLSDPADPLTDKAVTGQYPPGSTFKIAVALAALESGAINANTRIFCPGFYKLGNHTFYCDTHHGSLDVVGAIRESCDVFFYETGQRTGIDVIAKMAHRLGLGQKPGLDLPDVASGLVPTRAWKTQRYRERWQEGETLIASIGQGYDLASPLQLATMAARVANGGFAVTPTLLRAIDDAEKTPPPPAPIGLSPAHLALVQKGMEEVVSDPRGTAHSSQITTPPYSMAGKTGTAQVRRITAEMRREGLSRLKLPWKFRDHALFVGYGPVNKPAYAAAAIVEHGIWGALTAAPLVRGVLLAAMQRDPRLIRTVDAAEREHAKKKAEENGL
ncbi:MAG: penicillin-binding protein 2, partial [Alphaproteobacteria bacterium]|nr:penicillin-binding protein 2 [Alphaproteobacteria bacterium]